MKQLDKLAAILGTTESNAVKRASALHIMPVCGRCGGTGHYSFNGSHSICYGCGGSGQRMPKNDAEVNTVLREAENVKENGKLEEYLKFLKVVNLTRNASKKLMDAWTATGISNDYDWRKSYQGPGRDNDISAINKKMCDAYDRVSKAGDKISSKSPTYHADVIDFHAMIEKELQNIADAAAELEAYKKANPKE